jgi:hypothetical protein
MAKTPTEIASLARQHCPRAIQVLQGIMDNPRSAPQARIAAATALLNRGWGMPQITAEMETTVRYVIEAPAQLTGEEWEKEYGTPSAHIQ